VSHDNRDALAMTHPQIPPRDVVARRSGSGSRAYEPQSPSPTVEAIEHANRSARYALDRLSDDPDAHPGIQGHLTAARVQLEAALELAATSEQQQRAA
jgi:hypothetical protein